MKIFINGLQNRSAFRFTCRSIRSYFFGVKGKEGKENWCPGTPFRPLFAANDAANASSIVCRGGADIFLAGRASCLRVGQGDFAGGVGQNS